MIPTTRAAVHGNTQFFAYKAIEDVQISLHASLVTEVPSKYSNDSTFYFLTVSLQSLKKSGTSWETVSRELLSCAVDSVKFPTLTPVPVAARFAPWTRDLEASCEWLVLSSRFS